MEKIRPLQAQSRLTTLISSLYIQGADQESLMTVRQESGTLDLDIQELRTLLVQSRVTNQCKEYVFRTLAGYLEWGIILFDTETKDEVLPVLFGFLGIGKMRGSGMFSPVKSVRKEVERASYHQAVLELSQAEKMIDKDATLSHVQRSSLKAIYAKRNVEYNLWREEYKDMYDGEEL